MLLSLAVRNVLCNRRRSVITISSIVIDLAAMIFNWESTVGMNCKMARNTMWCLAGDTQVCLRGYHDNPILDLAIPDSAPVPHAVRSEAGVAVASIRLEIKMLASRGDKSCGLTPVGVKPTDEAQVTMLSDAIAAGQSLTTDASGVPIGEILAEALAVRPGQNIVFVGQGYDGSISSGKYPARGIFRSKIDDLDGYVAVMPLPVVRELFSAPGGATITALRLCECPRLESVNTGLAERLGDRHKVVGWPRLLPMVAVSSRLHEVTVYVVLLVFFVVVVFAVVNPVLMPVMECMREFGIMLAAGTSRTRVLRLVLYESILPGIVGLIAGNAVGWIVTAYFARVGIHLHGFEAGLRMMSGLFDVVYSVVSAERGVVLLVAVFVIAGLAALYPAAKVVQLWSIEAIRGLPAAMRVSSRNMGDSRLPVFVLLVLRSLLHNPHRTTLTAVGAAFGTVGFVFILGFFDRFFNQTIENSTRYLMGHIQVERRGFRKDYAPKLAVDDAVSLLQAVRGTSGVIAAAPHTQVQVLANTAPKSEGIMLIGIGPVAEVKVTFIFRTVVQGRALIPGADREVMIDRGLADKPGVRLGEKIVVMAQAASGEPSTTAYGVGGILSTESVSFNGAFASVTLSAAQSLPALGSRVSAINVRLEGRAHVSAAVVLLRARIDDTDATPISWRKLLPQFGDMVRLLCVMSSIILVVLPLVITTSATNTVFIVVIERTREFGVILALGMPPAALRRMVVYESIALLLIASVVGYGIGIVLVLYLGYAGTDLSSFFAGYFAIPGLTGIVYPRIFGATVVLLDITLLIAGVLISLYPAAKAARLDPV